MGGVWLTAKRTKRICVGALRSKRGSCSSGGCGVPQNGTPRDTVHLHRRPPLASTGSCSSSLHRALLHRLLFNHPSTGTPPPPTVHPALHTTGSCSTTPPPSTVHPALHTTGSCSSRGNATAHCSSKPPRNAHCSSQRQHRSASVSSSEGIAPSGSVNSHRSIARVQ